MLALLNRYYTAKMSATHLKLMFYNTVVAWILDFILPSSKPYPTVLSPPNTTDAPWSGFTNVWSPQRVFPASTDAGPKFYRWHCKSIHNTECCALLISRVTSTPVPQDHPQGISIKQPSIQDLVTLYSRNSQNRTSSIYLNESFRKIKQISLSDHKLAELIFEKSYIV